MADYASENKRIAKNTLALYARTIIVMVVSLYVSRVLLDKLGVEDYGVYNVVGSIVILFSFLNNALTAASQRFLSVALGENDQEKMLKVFNTSVSIQLILVGASILLLEIGGTWFLNNRLEIPDGRVEAANYAFQFSILTFALNFIRVPYSASVVAYERLDFFAYASIVDAVLKLAIAFMVGVTGFDKLVTYAFMLAFESFVMLLVYVAFCVIKFDTCAYIKIFDKGIFKEMFMFSGWTLFGGFSNVATQNGFLFMLNMFCGVVANAAMGIANQVMTALVTFVSSFQTSFQPQIVKSYAQGEMSRVHSLINSTSKFSFALMFIPACLLIVNIDLVLSVWLNNVPENAGRFCQILIICSMIDAITGPFYCAIMATGKIAKYQIAISVSFLLDLLLSLVLFKIGLEPYFILVSRILTRGLLNACIGVYFLKTLIAHNVMEYVKKTVLPIILVLALMSPICYKLYDSYEEWNRLWISIPTVCAFFLGLSYFILFAPSEREYIKSFIKKFKGRGNGHE